MTKIFDLSTAKADVQSTWERFGFTPTTDEERMLRQTKNPHVAQCRCRFCQSLEIIWGKREDI